MHLSENIDFTSAAIGGLMIGASSTALLATLGKISGISGIVGRSTIPCSKSTSLSAWMSEHSTTVSYILGLLGSGYVYMTQNDGFALTTGHGQQATLVTVLSGLFVGFGSRLGSGCVSGHGVCGLPRLSLRSLTAVSTFMLTGAGGAVVGRLLEQSHVSVPVVDALLQRMEDSGHFGHVPAAVVALSVFTFFLGMRAMTHDPVCDIKKTDGDKAPAASSVRLIDHAIHFATAFSFGWGLCVSGMTNADKVRGFLDFSGPDGWDPSLMGVMAGAVGFNLVTFRLLRQWQVVPVCASASCASLDKTVKYGSDPANMKVNRRLVVGAMIFGVGWGMGGLCPGPSLVQMGTASPLAQVYIPFMLLGMAVEELLLG
mmetsp:Transcript_2205/g.4123  ORF Transcript_2205/g.4123 Transcript_2205/m.4123 type:complete len:371 (-) Transcript_2205:358-1470(-)